MGKKSKQKQLRKAQAQAQAVQQPKINSGFTVNVSVPQGAAEAAMPTQPSQQPKAAQSVYLVSEEHIRSDILRIVLTLAVLAAILVALVIVNDRSQILHNAGNHLASFLKLQGN